MVNQYESLVKADRLLTTREVTKILGIGWNTLYRYIKENRLKAHKLGTRGYSRDSKNRMHWRIKQSDLDDFIEGVTGESTTNN